MAPQGFIQLEVFSHVETDASHDVSEFMYTQFSS